MIEFELKTDQGRVSLLGKSSKKRLDRVTFENLQSLFQRHGFDSDSNDFVSVPRPVALFPRWRMWLQVAVPGKIGSELLESGRFRWAAEPTTAALAKLHQCKFVGTRTSHTILAEIAHLESKLDEVALANPGLANLIRDVRFSCRQLPDSVSQKSALLHRDFYQDQILFSGDRTYLLDMDLLAPGHPALDIGNLLAHLTEFGIRKHDDPDFYSLEEVELRGHYQAKMPDVSAHEIAVFKAISLARHIHISWSYAEPATRRGDWRTLPAFTHKLDFPFANRSVSITAGSVSSPRAFVRLPKKRTPTRAFPNV